MVGALLLTNFARGTRKTESLFNVKRCSDEDWEIFAGFTFFTLFMVWISVS